MKATATLFLLREAAAPIQMPQQAPRREAHLCCTCVELFATSREDRRMHTRSTIFSMKDVCDTTSRRASAPRLRVCNAFPSKEPLSVAWRDVILTGDESGSSVTSSLLSSR